MKESESQLCLAGMPCWARRLDLRLEKRYPPQRTGRTDGNLKGHRTRLPAIRMKAHTAVCRLHYYVRDDMTGRR